MVEAGYLVLLVDLAIADLKPVERQDKIVGGPKELVTIVQEF
jgi:hypothetical protein